MDMWPEVFGADSRIPAICGKEKSWGKAEITMEQKKNRLHYAWFILAGCCILQATLGLINNCAGVFYSPICKELGFELGKLTMYRMLYCISSALALPFVATSFRKHDVRIVISIAAVIYGGCAALMGTFHELWQWHLTGIIQGIASSFVCMIPAPIILGNWFEKKTGMAVGISAAFSGLVGMIGSSFLGMAIPAFGWRVSYVAVGIVSTALVLRSPCSFSATSRKRWDFCLTGQRMWSKGRYQTYQRLHPKTGYVKKNCCVSRNFILPWVHTGPVCRART